MVEQKCHLYFFAPEINLLHRSLATFRLRQIIVKYVFFFDNKLICDTKTETKQIGTKIVIHFLEEPKKIF